jgi:hypothetical protein
MIRLVVEIRPTSEPVLLAELLPQVLAGCHPAPAATEPRDARFWSFELGADEDVSLTCL